MPPFASSSISFLFNRRTSFQGSASCSAFDAPTISPRSTESSRFLVPAKNTSSPFPKSSPLCQGALIVSAKKTTEATTCHLCRLLLHLTIAEVVKRQRRRRNSSCFLCRSQKRRQPKSSLLSSTFWEKVGRVICSIRPCRSFREILLQCRLPLRHLRFRRRKIVRSPNLHLHLRLNPSRTTSLPLAMLSEKHTGLSPQLPARRTKEVRRATKSAGKIESSNGSTKASS